MELTFIQGHKRLCKTFGDPNVQGGSRTYPLVKNITTHTETVNTLDEFREALIKHARCGHALYKGGFARKLENESRAGLTKNEALTEWMVIDVDGLPLPATDPSLFTPDLRGAYTSARLHTLAEKVIAKLPVAMSSVSYLAAASSSTGVKDTARLHLYFRLTSPVQTATLKTFLTSLNYHSDEITAQLQATANMRSVKNIFDPCLADNSRIIYIAPPEFETGTAPFANIEDRFVVVRKPYDTFDVDGAAAGLNPEIMRGKAIGRLKAIFKETGIKWVEPKLRTLTLGNQRVDIITNPGQVQMTLAYASKEFAYYNVNGGDSRAYYVPLDNPSIVYNFKGEPPFLFEEADPAAYASHLQTFAVAIKEAESKRGFRPMLFRDIDADVWLQVFYAPETDTIIDIKMSKSRENAIEWLATFGLVAPDLLESVEVVFDPTINNAFGKNPATGTKTLNIFRPTELMTRTEVSAFAGCRYEDAHHVMHVAPTIYRVLMHVMGNDYDCFKHFVNWLAFVWQTRDRAKTTWLWQGVQGTGKGLLFNQVFQPMFGVDYTSLQLFRTVAADKFNDWMANRLFVVLDEINTAHFDEDAVNLLKNLITEPYIAIRGMHKSSKQRRIYLNFLAYTNDINALKLGSVNDSERRWNIAPRQEIPLRLAHPDLHESSQEVDAIIAGELPFFCDFLRDFSVNEQHVRVPLQNDAKEAARAAGREPREVFFDAISTGDLSYFLDILHIPAAMTTPTSLIVQTLIRRWVMNADGVSGTEITTIELQMVHDLMVGRQTNAVTFGRDLKKHNLDVMRRRVDGDRQHCVEVVWQLNEDDRNAIVSSWTPEMLSQLRGRPETHH